MRPRAGHSWTAFQRGGRAIHLIQNDAGRWITTGEARGWRRCPRCRRPFEADPFDSGLCPVCYFYGSGLPATEFWRLHKEGYALAPYNIGERCTRTRLNYDELVNGDWRKALREQEIDTTPPRPSDPGEAAEDRKK